MDAAKTGEIFGFFNEVGIIAQLSSAVLARVLPGGIHPSHFAILNHLSRTGEGKNPVRIADAMQVTKATMTHSLAVLERRGFVTIAPSAVDARAKEVFMTEEGRRFHREAIEAVTKIVRQIFSDEDVAAIRNLEPGLRRIRKLLDDNRDATM